MVDEIFGIKLLREFEVTLAKDFFKCALCDRLILFLQGCSDQRSCEEQQTSANTYSYFHGFICDCIEAPELEWSAIATQSDRCSDKYAGKNQSKPKTGRTEVCSGSELWAVDRVHVEGKSL